MTTTQPRLFQVEDLPLFQGAAAYQAELDRADDLGLDVNDYSAAAGRPLTLAENLAAAQYAKLEFCGPPHELEEEACYLNDQLASRLLEEYPPEEWIPDYGSCEAYINAMVDSARARGLVRSPDEGDLVVALGVQLGSDPCRYCPTRDTCDNCA